MYPLYVGATINSHIQVIGDNQAIWLHKMKNKRDNFTIRCML